ncbi:LuxR C-terminal-related transcriptional regulator [Streptomyces sp. NPDC049577]|uniref:helix-turn-helix transcriptional regulator n=1 Tax=Streptomyces sp. NPDC049577 TaxID=3155153 RepID=UPI00343CD12C
MTAQQNTKDVLGAALHVRQTARRAVKGTGGAEGVLTALSALIDYDHASLSRWDPLRRRHLTLAGNYPAGATRYIEDRLHDDPGFSLIRDSADTTRWWHDVPGPVRRTSAGFHEVLEPLGVEDGVAQCLFTADGRYVGILNVSTTRTRCDQPAVRAVMTLLGECLAAVTDPLLGPGSSGGPGGAGDAAGPGGPALSPRELEVLAELTQGRTNREIAERLFLSPRTVATHIEHILAKLGVPNRAAAACRAVAWGLRPAA